MSQTKDFWVNPRLDTAQPLGDNPENYNQARLIELICGSLTILTILWKEWPKQMNCTVLENSRFSLTGKCPHINHDSVFMPVTSVHHLGDNRFCAAMPCQGCKGLILGIVYRYGEKDWRYETHYPMGSPDDSVDENVPKPIAEDFAEAMRCLWVKSYKAAVAMCRRSVEAACHDLGATGRNRYQKIEDLASQGAITDPMRRMAHRVRLTGNENLHGKGVASASASASASEFDADDLEG